jgi:hypothetical protein
VTEVPEHLLRRSRERRAALGLGGGEGGFIGAPLAIVVIGGLFSSTLLTLVLVPVLYSLTGRFTRPRAGRRLDQAFDDAATQRFASRSISS